MSKYVSKVLTSALGFGLLAGSPSAVEAQLDHLPYQLKYDRGQTVQPIFDGWSRNADGSFDMHFGYLNRNYVEEMHVPIGPDNRMETGESDRGQPDFFHVRSNRRIFTVTVPSDFGDQELVWSLTTQGETLRAIAWLDPQWEILENSTGLSTGDRIRQAEDEEPNSPPELTFSPSRFSVTLPASLTVTAMVRDDGRPEASDDDDQADPTDPQARPFVGTQSRPPLLDPPADALELPVNIPQHQAQRQSRPRDVVSVSYDVWRGPANITTEPYYAAVESGTATSRITFTEPGEYRLRVTVFDGELSTEDFVTVDVRE